MKSDGHTDADAVLDAWRARGDDRTDPVRFRLIEALTRRAAAHDGEVRKILNAKVRRLLAAYQDGLDTPKFTSSPPASGTAAPQARPTLGVLAELLDYIALHGLSHGVVPAGWSGASGQAFPSEVPTLGYFRNTWSQLSTERRLTQSLETVPENAGPLNSHHLVHRAFALMRDLSPDYLSQFMSSVDALLWLDKANESQALAGMGASGVDGQRKSGRGKSGG